MSMTTRDSTKSIIPCPLTMWHLLLGGFAATGFWEMWANWPTQLFAGFPLEPHELIKQLFRTWTGFETPDVWAKAIHYITGFCFYPAGYWLLTRMRSFGHPADGWIWGVITYFIALGFFAPIAGFPFLLIGDNSYLSFMSLIGHAIYGYVLAAVFEPLQARSRKSFAAAHEDGTRITQREIEQTAS